MINKMKKFKNQLILSSVIALLGTLFISLVISTVNAKGAGDDIGSEIGNLIGNAVGSAKAVMNADEFFEQGKEAGLSAVDTKITEINKTIQMTGKLRVLSADVTLDNLHEVGEDYKALYLMDGKLNFNVDLSVIKSDYDETNRILTVVIPEPTIDLKIDSESIKKCSESKKVFSFIPAGAGSEGYINSMNLTKENVREYIENYDSLLKIAKDESEIRVKELVGSLSFADEVVIEFAGGEQ